MYIKGKPGTELVGHGASNLIPEELNCDGNYNSNDKCCWELAASYSSVESKGLKEKVKEKEKGISWQINLWISWFHWAEL